MTLPDLLKNLKRIAAADAVLADSYLRLAASKSVVGILGVLLVAIGVSLLGWSLFWLIEPALGGVAAAAVLGAISCILGASLLVTATGLLQSRELVLAMQIRETAIDAFEQGLAGETKADAPAEAHSLSPALEAMLSALVRDLLIHVVGALRSRKGGQLSQSQVRAAGDDGNVSQ